LDSNTPKIEDPKSKNSQKNSQIKRIDPKSISNNLPCFHHLAYIISLKLLPPLHRLEEIHFYR